MEQRTKDYQLAYQNKTYRDYNKCLTKYNLANHPILANPFQYFFAYAHKIYLYKKGSDYDQHTFLFAPLPIINLEYLLEQKKINNNKILQEYKLSDTIPETGKYFKINTKELNNFYADIASNFNEELCNVLYYYLASHPQELLKTKLLPFYKTLNIPEKYLEINESLLATLTCTNLFKMPHLNKAFEYYLNCGLPSFLCEPSSFFFIANNSLYINTSTLNYLPQQYRRGYEPVSSDLFISIFRYSSVKEYHATLKDLDLHYNQTTSVQAFKKPDVKLAKLLYELVFDVLQNTPSNHIDIEPFCIYYNKSNISVKWDSNRKIELLKYNDNPMVILNCIFDWNIATVSDPIDLSACLTRLFHDVTVLNAFLQICSCIYSPSYTAKAFIIAAKDDELSILQKIIHFITNQGSISFKMYDFNKIATFTKLKRHRINGGNCIIINYCSSKAATLSFPKSFVDAIAGNTTTYKDIWNFQYQNSMPIIILTNRRDINKESNANYKVQTIDFTNIDLTAMLNTIEEFSEYEKLSIVLSLALQGLVMDNDIPQTKSCIPPITDLVKDFVNNFCEIGEDTLFTPNESLNRHFNEYYKKLYGNVYSNTKQGISQTLGKLYTPTETDTDILKKHKKTVPKGVDNPTGSTASLRGFRRIKIDHEKLYLFISESKEDANPNALPDLINEITSTYNEFFKH